MTKTLHFTKMHGAGNDYLYVNCLEKPLENPAHISQRLSHRRFGVGADGLILILPATSPDTDFSMRIFNADGSEGMMCGNGIRCFGKYVFERGLTDKPVLRIDTKSGVRTLELRIEQGRVRSVRVAMGEPILDPKLIPVLLPKEKIINEPFRILDADLRMTCVSMGNPHAVFFVDEITDDQILRLGPAIEHHEIFPERVNAEFVRVVSRNELTMRVWERGSGETHACGTGASAVLVAAVLNGLTERKATIHLLGGDLEIEWAADNQVYKTGPAEFVFDGTVEL